MGYLGKGLGPGTLERPTITVTDENVLVLVKANPIAKLVQLPHNRRWAIAVRGAKVQPAETWRTREEAIDGLRAMYANGVPS